MPSPRLECDMCAWQRGFLKSQQRNSSYILGYNLAVASRILCCSTMYHGASKD